MSDADVRRAAARPPLTAANPGAPCAAASRAGSRPPPGHDAHRQQCGPGQPLRGHADGGPPGNAPTRRSPLPHRRHGRPGGPAAVRHAHERDRTGRGDGRRGRSRTGAPQDRTAAFGPDPERGGGVGARLPGRPPPVRQDYRDRHGRGNLALGQGAGRSVRQRPNRLHRRPGLGRRLRGRPEQGRRHQGRGDQRRRPELGGRRALRRGPRRRPHRRHGHPGRPAPGRRRGHRDPDPPRPPTAPLHLPAPVTPRPGA